MVSLVELDPEDACAYVPDVEKLLKLMQKVQRTISKIKKVLRVGLPGVGRLNGSCGIRLPLSRDAQLPYSEKSEFFDDPLFKYSEYIFTKNYYLPSHPCRRLFVSKYQTISSRK